MRELTIDRFLLAAACAMVLVAGGCASEKAAREAELATLATELPGEYVSEAPDRPGKLSILPIRAGLIGKQLLYLEWADGAGGAPERRILSLEINSEKKLVQRASDFVDPPRWRAGLQQPELFLSLVPEDLRAAGRCNLRLRRSERANAPRALSALVANDRGCRGRSRPCASRE
jgi:hypothetical protein